MLARLSGALAQEDLRVVRDRVLLCFGMACCLCRSELLALGVAYLEQAPEGLRVTVLRSEADQGGRCAMVPTLSIDRCGQATELQDHRELHRRAEGGPAAAAVVDQVAINARKVSICLGSVRVVLAVATCVNACRA